MKYRVHYYDDMCQVEATAIIECETDSEGEIDGKANEYYEKNLKDNEYICGVKWHKISE